MRKLKKKIRGEIVTQVLVWEEIEDGLYQLQYLYIREEKQKLSLFYNFFHKVKSTLGYCFK